MKKTAFLLPILIACGSLLASFSQADTLLEEGNQVYDTNCQTSRHTKTVAASGSAQRRVINELWGNRYPAAATIYRPAQIGRGHLRRMPPVSAKIRNRKCGS